MKELDELREALQSCMRTENTDKPFDTYWITASAADVLIDAIEQAIAERYMEIAELLRNAAKVLHDEEWWKSGDYSKDTYRKTLAEFKDKWFKGNRDERLKDYDKLMPCPFCGGDAYMSELRDGMWRAICKSCNASGNNYFVEADAVAAWNTRAELTCNMNRVKEFPKYEDCVFKCWECSACKRTNDEQRPRFCPNCGAKVVY